MTDVRLYIVTRTDMASMNAGRTAAQCSHATNLFMKAMEHIKESLSEDDPIIQNYMNWINQTDQGYGTVIVLDGEDEQSIDNLMVNTSSDYLSGWVIDPEYPLADGKKVHILKDIKTCAFFFQFSNYDFGLKGLKLYGN